MEHAMDVLCPQIGQKIRALGTTVHYYIEHVSIVFAVLWHYGEFQ